MGADEGLGMGDTETRPNMGRIIHGAGSNGMGRLSRCGTKVGKGPSQVKVCAKIEGVIQGQRQQPLDAILVGQEKRHINGKAGCGRRVVVVWGGKNESRLTCIDGRVCAISTDGDEWHRDPFGASHEL
jgi:hypothetical protein